MSNYNVNPQDQKLVESIRRQYIRREDNKIEQLQKLDAQVKMPGMVASTTLGVIGALIMGAGMANVMVWSNLALGLILGIPGMLMALAAYPVYVALTERRKKKYAADILRLSAEVTA